MRVRSGLTVFLSIVTLLLSSQARAREDGGLPLYGRLYLGAGYLNIDPRGEEDDQHGPVFSGQLDLGVRLTGLVGLHVVGLYDVSRSMKVDSLRGSDYEGGAFGVGAGAELRLLSLLTSLSLGWQSTEFTTNADPGSASGAKSGFVLARVGYVLPLPLGLGVGAHAFGKLGWSGDDEQGGHRYDPRSFTLGALLSVGLDGSRPLLF
jgi:hypothetical protein